MTDFSDFFGGLFPHFNETREQITDKYIKGIIDKDEFIRRMKAAERGGRYGQ